MVASSSASEPRARSRNDGSPSKPSGVKACRSRPAEKETPSPRSTTTRTCPGSSRPASLSARHRAGDWALRRAALHRVMCATESSMASRTPSRSSRILASGIGHLRADRGLDYRRVTIQSDRRAAGPTRGASGCGSLLAPCGTAATAQGHAGLAEHPVHESVGAAGFLGQRPDARTGVVLLLQVCRELLARGAGHPAALLQSLGHPCLLQGSALWTLMITPRGVPGHPFDKFRHGTFAQGMPG